jgi:hypothetical protein
LDAEIDVLLQGERVVGRLVLSAQTAGWLARLIG